MRKLIIVLFISILSIGLVACGEENDQFGENGLAKLKVGATAVPHAEILEEIKPILEDEGVNLEIIQYQDFVLPNINLSEGEIDANFFQHEPYFESFTAERKITNLTNVLKVHIEPMGIYSNKIDDLSKLQKGAQVSIPNDPSNMGRALALLEKAELITLKEGVGVKGTKEDIISNPYNLDIVLLDAPMLPRSLDDVAIAVINTNFALQVNLNPTEDALFIENEESPYANVLTIRTEDLEDERIKKLVKALSSDQVRKFIEEKYQGAIVPVF